MRKSAIQLKRLSTICGRLGFVAVSLVGTGRLIESQAWAQTPHAGTPALSRKNLPTREGNSSREARENAVQRIPFTQLTQEASNRIHSVVDSASYFRRMPTETVDCDQEMFTFLVRNPEVIVNIWEVMGVTKVTLKRVGPYQLQGSDGAGTNSKMDLVFGNDSMHIYYANGSYNGNLWARELPGRCIVILYNRPAKLQNGEAGMVVSMDVFMKLENIGADLVVKTLGPLVGKTADYNFTECAAFFSQLSQTAESNPLGLQQLASRLTDVDPKTRDQFNSTIVSVAKRAGTLPETPTPRAVAATTAPIELLPVMSASKTVKPVDHSTRRTADATSAITDERVDSPTILLIGKEDQSKSPKP